MPTPTTRRYAWHNLTNQQIAALEKNNNNCADWSKIFVTASFNTTLVRNNTFCGVMHIADLEDKILSYNGLEYRTGIRGCYIANCNIGANAVLQNIGRVKNYSVGNECVITNVCELVTTTDPKYGCGVEIKAMNEGGNRHFNTFADMLPADAYLQCKFMGNKPLQTALQSITAAENKKLPQCGTIGDNCLIRNCNTIENSNILPHCQITGANLIKNSTIKSSVTEPTAILHGVILEDCIVGYSCNILGNSIVQKSLLGSDVTVEKGARIINTMVGDNSTIACAEVQNSMLFHSHQQHHNNSFLIATSLLGQSNIAAGVTIGSNHNSRTACGEILAGRGFWPGLCSSFKHPSRFASFALVAKADYQHELNIPLPFALINNNLHSNELEIMPAYWWMYNMYALERNEYKFQHRDKRIEKQQNIESHTLAPDTAEEIIAAIALIELWVGTAAHAGKKTKLSRNMLIEKGRKLLKTNPSQVEQLKVFAEGLENSRRKVRILKAQKAYNAYHQMLLHYAVDTLTDYCHDHSWEKIKSLASDNQRTTRWVNLGGQLIAGHDFDNLCSDIASDKLSSWQQIHQRYRQLWLDYPLQKCHHAFDVLTMLNSGKALSKTNWNAMLKRFVDIQEYIAQQTLLTRDKDFQNSFYTCTFDNFEEQIAVLERIANDEVIKRTFQNFINYKENILRNTKQKKQLVSNQ